MTALLPTRANTLGGTVNGRVRRPVHNNCTAHARLPQGFGALPACLRRVSVLAQSSSPSQQQQQEDKVSRPPPPSPPEPTPSPDGRPRSRVTVRLARGPARLWSRRGRRFRGDAARSRAVHGRSSSVWPRPRRRGCSRACVSVPGTAERWPASR